MNAATTRQIRKRDGSLQPFMADKIARAIDKAFTATKTEGEALAPRLAGQVVGIIESHFPDAVPGVEDVQDAVEQVLMSEGYPAVAKAYILYRQQRADVRRYKRMIGVQDDLKLTVNAVRVLERRYLLKDDQGRVIETPRQLFRRVAHAIAAVETSFNPASPASDVKALEDQFFNLMAHLEFIPNTPTLMNAWRASGTIIRLLCLAGGRLHYQHLRHAEEHGADSPIRRRYRFLFHPTAPEGGHRSLHDGRGVRPGLFHESL